MPISSDRMKGPVTDAPAAKNSLAAMSQEELMHVRTSSDGDDKLNINAKLAAKANQTPTRQQQRQMMVKGVHAFHTKKRMKVVLLETATRDMTSVEVVNEDGTKTFQAAVKNLVIL